MPMSPSAKWGVLIMAAALVAGCGEPMGPSATEPEFTARCDSGHRSGDCAEKLVQAGVATGTMLNVCRSGLTWACLSAAGLAGAAWIRYGEGQDAFGHRHAEDCGFCTDPETEDRDKWWSVGRAP